MEIEGHVRGAAAGDPVAFEALVSHYQGPVCAVAYGIVGDVSLSEDVAQEAFVAAWKGLPSLRSPERFSGWLFAITKNIARTVLRKGARDVLRNAAPVEDREVASPPLDLPETADAVWDALEKLPETYRIPLVMYYREGESTAAVAAHLGISEENARQRMSRGRSMLKEHVAHLVEDILSNTQPSSAFTASVMSLAAVGMTTSAAAHAGVATASVAKGAVVVGNGFAGGVAVYLLGPLFGMTGGFFGMWTSIRNAQTLEIRRATLRHGGMLYAGVWLFLGMLSMAGALFWGTPKPMGIAVSGAWMVYIPLLGVAIVMINRHQRRLAEAAVHGDAATLLNESYTRCVRWVWITYGIAVVGSSGLVAVVHSIPGMHWGWAVGLLAICHGIYAVMVRRGLSISFDDQAFECTAPSQGPEEFLSPLARGAIRGDKQRGRSQVGGLAGGILGGSAWLVLVLAQSGLYISSAFVLVAQTAILIATWRCMLAEGARTGRIAALSMTAAGAVSGGVLLLHWRTSLEIGAYVPEYFNVIAGVAIFATYVLFGFIAYLLNPDEQSGTSLD